MIRHSLVRSAMFGCVVILAVIGGGTFLFASTSYAAPATTRRVSGRMPLPKGSPPAPKLANIVPSAAKVTAESWVRLSKGPPEVVVTDSAPSPTSPDGNAQDLLLLAWDEFAKRWVVVFDAAKTPGNTILPPNAAVSGLGYATISPKADRTDLALWAGVSFGTNAPFDAYIVHYNGQSASIVYSSNGEGGSAKVIGKPPKQRLLLTYEWISPVDPECCAVRFYTQEIGWQPPSVSHGGDELPGDYGVVSDNRSWLGVYVAVEPPTNGTYPPPVVMTVVPGGPAAGVLQPGDQLLSVAGVTLPKNNSASLGPSVIDEIDSQLPDTPIALLIERDGQQLTENIRLSSYANPAQLNASPPTPGYLGVEVASDSPQLASEYQLGTSSGAVVEAVESGSAADQAGLTEYDVITALGSRQITDIQDLLSAILICPAFSTQPLTYVDPSGTSHTVNVEMGTYPSDGSAPAVDEI